VIVALAAALAGASRSWSNLALVLGLLGAALVVVMILWAEFRGIAIGSLTFLCLSGTTISAYIATSGSTTARSAPITVVGIHSSSPIARTRGGYVFAGEGYSNDVPSPMVVGLTHQLHYNPLFGSAGVALHRVGTAAAHLDSVTAAAQGGGYYAAGVGDFGDSSAAFLIRVRSGGQFDRRFGRNGVVRRGHRVLYSGAYTLSDSTGRVLMAFSDLRDFIAPGQDPLVSTVSRFDTDGSPDLAFGSGGSAAVPDGGDPIRALALTPGGEIVVASGTVAVLHDDGFVDSAFQYSRTAEPDNVQWESLAVAADGHIELAGTVASGAIVVTRLLPSGAIDTKFGMSHGWSKIPSPIPESDVSSMVEFSSGDTILCLTSSSAADSGKVTLIQLGRDGRPVSSFSRRSSAALESSTRHAPPSAGGWIIGIPHQRLLYLQEGVRGQPHILDGRLTAAVLRHDGSLDTSTGKPAHANIATVDDTPRAGVALGVRWHLRCQTIPGTNPKTPAGCASAFTMPSGKIECQATIQLGIECKQRFRQGQLYASMGSLATGPLPQPKLLWKKTFPPVAAVLSPGVASIFGDVGDRISCTAVISALICDNDYGHGFALEHGLVYRW
jgi:hypothetical protein